MNVADEEKYVFMQSLGVRIGCRSCDVASAPAVAVEAAAEEKKENVEAAKQREAEYGDGEDEEENEEEEVVELAEPFQGASEVEEELTEKEVSEKVKVETPVQEQAPLKVEVKVEPMQEETSQTRSKRIRI